MTKRPSVWSMTGYGQGQTDLGGQTLEVQIRCVNHRHADVRVKLPSELSGPGAFLEDRVKARVRRGRAEVSVRYEAGRSDVPQLDLGLAKQAFSQLSEMRDQLDPEQVVPLSMLTSVPGLFHGSRKLDAEEARAALTVCCDAALESLDAMRSQEGRALAEDLLSRLTQIGSDVDWLETVRPEVVAQARERLRGRLEALLDGTGVQLDDGRLEHEVALFADRSDVAEEITRLRSHLGQFVSLLAEDKEPVGRKLDFLLQEIGREVNTVGSKANDAGIAQRVVDLKAELERVREQIQNIL